MNQKNKIAKCYITLFISIYEYCKQNFEYVNTLQCCLTPTSPRFFLLKLELNCLLLLVLSRITYLENFYPFVYTDLNNLQKKKIQLQHPSFKIKHPSIFNCNVLPED